MICNPRRVQNVSIVRISFHLFSRADFTLTGYYCISQIRLFSLTSYTCWYYRLIRIFIHSFLAQISWNKLLFSIHRIFLDCRGERRGQMNKKDNNPCCTVLKQLRNYSNNVFHWNASYNRKWWMMDLQEASG